MLRAFTVAALALDAGADAIACVRTVEEALALRDAQEGRLAMGERDGRPVPGFDLGNSPSRLRSADLAGRTLVHRTSAGTQGLVAASATAGHLFAASFACAGATASAVRAVAPEAVTFVATGVDHRDGDEDVACAEYIAALLTSGPVDAQSYLGRVRTSDAAQAFLRGDSDFPEDDLDEAVRLDAVAFSLRAALDDGVAILRRHHAEGA